MATTKSKTPAKGKGKTTTAPKSKVNKIAPRATGDQKPYLKVKSTDSKPITEHKIQSGSDELSKNTAIPHVEIDRDGKRPSETVTTTRHSTGKFVKTVKNADGSVKKQYLSDRED